MASFASRGSLSIALTACVYLTWGGLLWVPVAVCLCCALMLGGLSTPFRWRGFFRGLRHLVRDDTDLHMLEFGAASFLGPLAETKKPSLWPRPSHVAAAHEQG